MNAIPLIKGNTPQEINTSIIALKKALSELEAQDRLLQGTDKDVQDKIKQINELIEGINTHLGTVDTHLGTIDSQITALQPVDTVTSGNMQSVTSNAVANELTHYQPKDSILTIIGGSEIYEFAMGENQVAYVTMAVGNMVTFSVYAITCGWAGLIFPALVAGQDNLSFSIDNNYKVTITNRTSVITIISIKYVNL